MILSPVNFMEDVRSDEDVGLMRRIAERDPSAFHALADKYMQRSLRFVERLVGNRATAEDIVQEAFEAVWKQAPQWKPVAKFATWFHQVLSNIAHRQFRDRLRGHAEIDDDLVDDKEGAEERLLKDEKSVLVSEALQELPERQRLAIVLVYYEDMSQREACSVMEIQEGALESLLSRGRAQLKMKLAKRYMN